MRIDDRTRKIIIDSVKAVFSPDTEVWLFRSCCDDNAKGGDIDLHIETPELDAPVARRINLKVLLSDQLEEQKIDVIVHNRNRPPATHSSNRQEHRAETGRLIPPARPYSNFKGA